MGSGFGEDGQQTVRGWAVDWWRMDSGLVEDGQWIG